MPSGRAKTRNIKTKKKGGDDFVIADHPNAPPSAPNVAQKSTLLYLPAEMQKVVVSGTTVKPLRSIRNQPAGASISKPTCDSSRASANIEMNRVDGGGSPSHTDSAGVLLYFLFLSCRLFICQQNRPLPNADPAVLSDLVQIVRTLLI